MGRFKDLTGQKFGRLTVIERAENHYTTGGRSQITWLCRCECGNNVIVNGQNLISSNTKSCGCLHREIVSNTGRQNKRYNIYDLSNEYGIGFTSKGEEFYFDLEDYDKIKEFCWFKNKSGYFSAKDDRLNSHIELHRIIMNTQNIPFDTGVRVDHIKTEDKFDNRKCNLRVVQHCENSQNHKLYSSNTSDVSGVNYNKSHHKWASRISYKGIRYNLGFFDNFDDAVMARKNAEQELYGEHSYDNSQKLANENLIKLKQEEVHNGQIW